MTDQKPLKIYNASAGSGKTYTLVQEYLDIIFNSEDISKFRSILAMTFTNKAANEMKTRILEALIDLSVPYSQKNEKQLDLLNNTVKKTHKTVQQIEMLAPKILNKILHNYSSFSIMTIDKFTHKIIRTFARDLGVSIDFDVELDVETLRKNVTDLLIAQIGKDKELTRLMLIYANENLDDDKSWNFAGELYKFSDLLFKENALKAIDALKPLTSKDFEVIKKQLKTENSIIENKLLSLAQQAVDVIKFNGLTDDDFHYKKQGPQTFFYKILKKTFDLPTERVISYMDDVNLGNEKVNQISDVLVNYYQQILTIIEQEVPTYNLNKTQLKNINNLSLLNHLIKMVDEIKEEENILLISDFHKKIADLITKEPVPFIYEHLGTRYEHFLLDEFQDTSKLQWVNMIPLVHDSLATYSKNLIVGDGKQAIYRWRNGEVEQFAKLPDEIYNPENIKSLREAEPLFKALGEKKPLEDNWRSAREVVEFNNALFKELGQKLHPNLKYIYNDVVQNVKKEHQGYIHAIFKEDTTEENQLEYTLKAIKDSLQAGFQQKDICVIVRSNKKGALIANYLSEHRIDVISPDSLFISKDVTVKFLFHLLNGIIHPKDTNYKIKALEHYALLKSLNVTDFIANKVSKTEPETLIQIFEKEGVIIPQISDFHNLYEFIEALIQNFNFDAGSNTFLQFFMEMVHQYENQNNSNLRDFIEYYLEKGTTKSIISPEGANAVQIMTIHKSKGLQFPVVICPFLNWSKKLSMQISWIEKDNTKLPSFYVNITNRLNTSGLSDIFETEESKYYLDVINLLYVAFTRAETALFLCGSNSEFTTKDWLIPFFEKAEFITNLPDNSYEYGYLINSSKKDTTLKAPYQLDFLKQVMNKPALSYKSGQEWDINTVDKKANFGTLIHKTLAKLNSIDDLEEVMSTFKNKGLIDNELKEKITNYVKTLFKDTTFSQYFNPKHKILNEKEIIDSKGHKLIPDKVIIKENEILIVDFKTGEESSTHSRQIKQYINLYKNMGYQNIKGVIYYTENQKAIAV
jgi:ATP-dependent exoDNAse (exonuclease V) beta subunit